MMAMRALQYASRGSVAALDLSPPAKRGAKKDRKIQRMRRNADPLGRRVIMPRLRAYGRLGRALDPQKRALRRRPRRFRAARAGAGAVPLAEEARPPCGVSMASHADRSSPPSELGGDGPQRLSASGLSLALLVRRGRLGLGRTRRHVERANRDPAEPAPERNALCQKDDEHSAQHHRAERRRLPAT